MAARMERVMMILVFVGLVFNALTLLIVAHYFNSKEGVLAAPGVQNLTSSRAADTGAAETQRKLASLETTLNSLSKKIDGLASRSSVAQSGFNASGGVRGPRNRSGTPRRPASAGAAQGEDAEAEEAEAQPADNPRRLEPRATFQPGAAGPVIDQQKPAPAGAPEGAAGQPAPAVPPNGEAPAPAGGENGGAEAPAGGTPPAGAPAGGAEGTTGNGGGA